MLYLLVIVPAVLAGAILALRVLFPLPPQDARPPSAAIPCCGATRLGTAIGPRAAACPGLSGVRPLPDGRDAFAMRMHLAHEAQATIDAQYYIWQDDATGTMLLDALRQAAARGVRVRLLLDDNGIGGLDAALAGLHALPTAEVRLWNPFTTRWLKELGYLFDFPRLNRRMHNKSFTVDGAAAILGGRNVGDVYFGYGEGAHYIDLDALVVGPAAEAVGRDFDRYWAAASAYPADRILAPAPEGLEALAAAARRAAEAPETGPYAAAIRASDLIRAVTAGEDIFEWVPVTLVSDDPAKGLGLARNGDLLLARMLDHVGQPEATLDLVSAYFVPGREGTAALAALARRGVAVRVLTNAWEAADVPLVHAGYASRRADLAGAGVTLLELRAGTAGSGPARDIDLVGSGSLGASASSLHAKTMVFDGRRVFIGSFNFDPRSARLNTELGIVVDSPAIARAVGAMMDRVGRSEAYRVERGPDGALRWIAGQAGGPAVPLSPEPGTTPLGRLALRILGRLPIEWLL